MGALRVAVGFLTRIPVGHTATGDTALAASLVWFPVVGAVVGAFTAALYGALGSVTPPLVASVVAVASATYLTGAFHEDGLADTADALGGSFDRDRALEILKDPRHGSFGVLALVLSAAVRIAAIAALHPLAALVVLPSAHALSRGAAIQLTGVLPPAGSGLGASYAAFATRRRLVVAGIVALAIAVVLLGTLGLVAAVATVPAVAWLGRLSARRLGGITGDVLGAAQQLAELSILVVALAVIPAGSEGVWWS